MTVGEPEINLNSWGIRYVKVKQSPTSEIDKDPKEPTFTEPKTGETKETKRGVQTEFDHRTPKTETSPTSEIDKDPRDMKPLTVTDDKGRKTTKPVSHEGDSREFSTGGLSDADASTSTFSDRKEDSKGDTDVTVQDTQKPTEQKEQQHTFQYTRGRDNYERITGGKERPKEGSTQGGKGTKTLTTGQHGTQTGKKGVPKFDAPKQSAVSGHVGSNVGHDSGIKNPDADKKRVSGKGKPTVFKKPKEGEGGTAASGEKFDEAHAKRMRKAIMDMNIAILKCNSFKMKRMNYSGDSKYGDENTGDARIDDDPEPLKDSQAVQSKTETLAPDREDETEVSSYGSGATGQHGKEGDKKLNSEGEIVRKAIELINEAYAQIGKFNHGSGARKPSDVGLCDTCGGSGGHDDPDKHDSKNDCPSCGGNGSAITKPVKDSKTNKADSAVTTGTEGTNNPVMAGKDDPYHVSEYLDSLTTRERDERNNTWRPHPDDNTPKDDY